MSSQTQSFKIEFGWFFLKNQPYSDSPSKKAYYRDPYMFGFILRACFLGGVVINALMPMRFV